MDTFSAFMGQEKVCKLRNINTHLKKKRKPIEYELVQKLPGPYDSYPKVARNQPKPRVAVIARYLQNPPAVQRVSRNLEKPKAKNPKPLKPAKARNQSVSAESSIFARSLPTYSELEFNFIKAKPAAAKTIKFENHPNSRELGTKQTSNSHKDCIPKKLLQHRRDDQKTVPKSKKSVKPEIIQCLSPPAKKNRSVEIKRRELIKQSKKIESKVRSYDVLQAHRKTLLSRECDETKTKQRKSRKGPESKSCDIPKRTGVDQYPGSILCFREQGSRDRTEVSHSLPKLPGELRSILKSSMNYSQIKKLDEDSLERITEGKGPADECLCNLLSTSDSREKGIKASIRRAFASFSGGKKRGAPAGVQNSVDIPLSFTQGGKGGLYSTKEVVRRKSPCGKCGCDKGPVVLKHSYANIRITSPDLSTICSCPEDCFPDKDKYNGKIKVTVERMALNSDDSELSLHKRTQQLAIPEPLLKGNMVQEDDGSLGELSDGSEWSSGD